MASDTQGGSSGRMNRNQVVLLAVLVVGVAVLFLGLGYLLWGQNTAVSATPTPFAETNPEGVGGEPLIFGISDSGTVSVTLDLPITLKLADREFAVRAERVTAEGTWSPEASEDTAVWVYGSVVNYVFGLQATDETQTLLEGLTPGDEITVVTRGGASLPFLFESRQMIPKNNRDVFAQNRPGVTLILIGMSGEERLVVNGRFAADRATTPQLEDNRIELGETAQLDNIQITVTGAAYVPSRPEIPPGFAFYQIDFQVQNVGLTALDTSRLRFTLLDDLGNQYALNPAASQVGNYPPLSGFLNVGQSVQATAGYQIPAGLVSNTLGWVVSRTDTNSQIQVIIPFNGSNRALLGSSVSLVRAEVSSDLTNLILAGQITNVGEQPLVVTENDVSLRTADGSAYLLLSTNPAFPWTVPPGQSASFTVIFQRPVTSDSAVFTVLNQPFQLTGLR